MNNSTICLSFDIILSEEGQGVEAWENIYRRKEMKGWEGEFWMGGKRGKWGEIMQKCLIFCNQERARGRRPRKREGGTGNVRNGKWKVWTPLCIPTIPPPPPPSTTWKKGIDHFHTRLNHENFLLTMSISYSLQLTQSEICGHKQPQRWTKEGS